MAENDFRLEELNFSVGVVLIKMQLLLWIQILLNNIYVNNLIRLVSGHIFITSHL